MHTPKCCAKLQAVSTDHASPGAALHNWLQLAPSSTTSAYAQLAASAACSCAANGACCRAAWHDGSRRSVAPLLLGRPLAGRRREGGKAAILLAPAVCLRLACGLPAGLLLPLALLLLRLLLLLGVPSLLREAALPTLAQPCRSTATSAHHPWFTNEPDP